MTVHRSSFDSSLQCDVVVDKVSQGPGGAAFQASAVITRTTCTLACG